MRARKTTRLPTLLLVGIPLLGLTSAGCLTTVPVCTAAQILTTDQNGSLVCAAAPASSFPLSCSGMLISDGKNLGCTTLTDQTAQSGLPELTSTAADLQKQLAQDYTLKFARYVGVTTGTYRGGNFAPGNNYAGMAAGAKLCVSQFGAGAHMCLMDELYMSATRGPLGSADRIPPAWIFMPNWNLNNNPGVTAEGQAGIADTCGDYTYGSGGASRYWHSTLVEWSPLPSGDTGLRFRNSGSCAPSYPIACCK